MTVAEEQDIERRAPPRVSPEWLRARVASLPREAIVSLALVATMVLAGGLLRFWDLGTRAFHHDESLHATFSWYLADGRGYLHDPLMHGTFLFESTALTYLLFGDGDYQARIVPALFGTALIAMAWLLRDRIGAWGVAFLAFFLAFSPTLLYFSRFLRNDIFIAVWTLGLVIALWRYVDRRDPRYLVAAAALLAFSFATKETTFITSAIFIAYFNLYAAWQLAEQTRDGREWPAPLCWAVAAAYAPVAWAVVALWPLVGDLREGLRLRERTPVMDVVLVLGTLMLPQFAAILGAPLRDLGGFANPAPWWFRPTPGLESMIGVVSLGALVSVIALIAATAAVGLSWNRRTWALCGLAFYVIYFTLFTTFFTNVHGFSSSIWGSLDYWLVQHDVRRGDQPVFYYLMLLPMYEFLPLLIGTLAAVPLLLRGNAFTRFLLVWFGATLYGLSVSGEKMPWLNVHVALPLAVLAAYGMGQVAERVDWRALRPHRPRAWAVSLGAVAFAAISVLTVRTAVVASFGHGANGAKPVEMLVYTQTSPELLDALRRIEAYAASTGQGKNLAIYVDSSEGLAWPWAWYLRHYPRALYIDFTNGYQPPAGSVALVYASHIIPFDQHPETWTKDAAYTHRWWFPEVYKGTDLRKVAIDVREPDTWRLWKRYFFDRTPPADIGRLYAVIYLPAAAGG